MSSLISIEEARRRVLAAARPPAPEQVPLGAALGRVLAQDLESRIDVPPFASSAMDGFARAAGPAAELALAGESRAGCPFDGQLERGQAVRISTGAMVPVGANAVVPVELSEEAGGGVRLPATFPGQNVRGAGEDVRAGAVALEAGTRLGAAEVAVAASLGRAELPCSPRPRVALLLTGDELVDPGAPLAPGQIYSSNGWALAGQAAAAGADVVLSETVPDSAKATRAALTRALEVADVVCASGGVSVGAHDHVKGELAALGVRETFWGVRVKPGKPTWFGTRGDVLVFGLPGNPVSAMVTFQLFANPALRALQGERFEPQRSSATLTAPVRLSPEREQAVRVRLEGAGNGAAGDHRAGSAHGGWLATPTGEQGSHRLTSMLGARALAIVPAGEGFLGAGERVELELL